MEEESKNSSSEGSKAQSSQVLTSKDAQEQLEISQPTEQTLPEKTDKATSVQTPIAGEDNSAKVITELQAIEKEKQQVARSQHMATGFAEIAGPPPAPVSLHTGLQSMADVADEKEDLDMNNLSNYTVRELKAFCAKHDMKVKGQKKQDYIDAIEERSSEE